MVRCGSSIYSSIDDFEADLPLRANSIQLQPGRFRARITWLELPRVRLVFVREAPARIAYVASPSDHVLIAFPGHRAAPLICDGISLHWGDAIIYNPGSRFHQRTAEAGAWGAISIAPSTLRSAGKILHDRELVIPPDGSVWRSRESDMRELLGLHKQAMRFAEGALDRVAHAEIVRSLEDDLVVSIVRAFACSGAQCAQDTERSRVHAMRRLEEVLDMPRGNLRVPDVYKSAGLTKTQLQTFSRQVLGLSVARYVRVRRLKQACQALLSIASRAEAAEVVKEYGFADLEKFAAAFYRAFGATASSLCLLNILNGSGHRGEGNQRRGRR